MCNTNEVLDPSQVKCKASASSQSISKLNLVSIIFSTVTTLKAHPIFWSVHGVCQRIGAGQGLSIEPVVVSSGSLGRWQRTYGGKDNKANRFH